MKITQPTGAPLAAAAIEIWTAGVDAVRAQPLVSRAVSVQGQELLIADRIWSRKYYDRLLVVGAGKAATAMAEGLLQAASEWAPIQGWINVPAGTEKSLPGIHVHPARAAGANEPTAAGVAGTERIIQLFAEANQRDLCLALISGGGSALLPAPVAGVTLDDKLAVTRLLSSAGANITELNTVRKQLSRIKGGGLLRACRGGELITLVLSDVLGDPLDVIASGPTVLHESTADDALSVLARYDPNRTLAASIYRAIGQPAETPLPTTIPNHIFVIGNNLTAVDQAGAQATALGYEAETASADACEGAAEQVGRELAERLLTQLHCPSAGLAGQCFVSGGEPTVQLAPVEIRGTGGRNQQLVLAAYQQLLQQGLSAQEWSRLALLSGGTDGEDGPCDAAGAHIDQDVHRRAVDLQLDVDDYLHRNDAYHFFAQTGGLLVTGPTGTNVCDLRVGLTGPA